MANRLRAAWSPGLRDSCSQPTLGGLAAVAATATKATTFASCGSGDETQSPSSPAYASSSSPLRRGRHSWYGSPLIADVVDGRSGKVASPSSTQDSGDSLAETSRHVLREVNTQARFEALYRDGESRRKRREATEREKMHKEEEELKMLQTKHQPPRRRAWEPRWASEQSLAYARKQQALKDRRQREAASKENEALKECSFAPRLVAGDSSRRRKLAKARRILEELAEEQKIWFQRAEVLRVEFAHHVARSDDASNERYGHDQESDSDSDSENTSSSDECDGKGANTAFGSILEDREEWRVAAERRYRLGMLQVLDSLARLQTQALAIISRSLGQSSSRDQSSESLVAATGYLREMCPAFDLDVLPRLRADVSRFDVPADPGCVWEVPGALLRAPVPVQVPSEESPPSSKDDQPDVDSGEQRDEARPWTWTWN